MFDKLRLPFRFIPDGSPEAQVPPAPGHIRIPAVFRPHPRAHLPSEEADDGWFEGGIADDATDGEGPRGHPGPVAGDSADAARLYPHSVATYMRVSGRVFGDVHSRPAETADDLAQDAALSPHADAPEADKS